MENYSIMILKTVSGPCGIGGRQKSGGFCIFKERQWRRNSFLILVAAAATALPYQLDQLKRCGCHPGIVRAELSSGALPCRAKWIHIAVGRAYQVTRSGRIEARGRQTATFRKTVKFIAIDLENYIIS